ELIRRKHHFVSFGRPSGAIEVHLIVWHDGVPKLDLRRYVSTGKYTGATKSGVSLTVEEVATLLKLGDEILEKSVKLLREGPWDGAIEDKSGLSLGPNER